MNGVRNIHKHPETDQKGTWIILSKNITTEELSNIDQLLSEQRHNVTLGCAPRRTSNNDGRVNTILAEAWKKQNAAFRAPTRNTDNAWSTPLVPSKKIFDDKSVATTMTMTSQEEKIEQLKKKVENLVTTIENISDKTTLTSHEEKIEQLTKKVENLVITIENISEENTALKAKLNELEERFEDKNDELEVRLTKIEGSLYNFGEVMTEGFQQVNKKMDVQSSVYDFKIEKLSQKLEEQTDKIVEMMKDLLQKTNKTLDSCHPLGKTKTKGRRK